MMNDVDPAALLAATRALAAARSARDRVYARRKAEIARLPEARTALDARLALKAAELSRDIACLDFVTASPGESFAASAALKAAMARLTGAVEAVAAARKPLRLARRALMAQGLGEECRAARDAHARAGRLVADLDREYPLWEGGRREGEGLVKPGDGADWEDTPTGVEHADAESDEAWANVA
jgi:hypothetical protein